MSKEHPERRDSLESIKSFKSYSAVRDSLNNLHTFVDKVFKDANSSKMLDRSSRSDISADDIHSKSNLKIIEE